MNDLRLQALFHAALERPAEQRRAFIRCAAAGDDSVLTQLGELLAIDEQLGDRTLKPLVPDLDRLLAAPAGNSPAPGLRVGPYQLREPIGSGGMGRVFRAERVDGSVAQTVAIKFVHRELLDADTRRRFLLERQLLATLDHPNVARLLDAAELADGTPYVVMEFVDGVPITDFCRQQQLDLRARLALVRSVCAAVAEAHRKLVVHRDLKPGNLLVSAAGVPKLIDFGIAKPLSPVAATEQTGTAQRYFSPLYAAPEQLRGDTVGVACDVYGLGLLLYELLAGCRPFDFRELSAAQIERLVLDTPPPLPSAACTAVEGGIRARLLRGESPLPARLLRGESPFPARLLRGELDAIVMRCLRKAPAERYRSVEQLEADLDNFLAGRPVQARGGHRWYRLRKFIGRQRSAVALGTLAFAMLIGASALLLRKNLELTHERDRSRYALGLLTDAFSAADPGHAAGGTVSARQVLDAATGRIDETYDSRPDIYVDLARSVARIQFNLGLWPQAAELARRAGLAAGRAGLSAGEIGRLQILQAMALTDSGKVHEAERLLGDGAVADIARLPEWQLARGRVLVQLNRPEQAIAVLREALAQVQARPATDDLATLVRWELAAALRVAEQDPQALAILDQTLAWQRQSLPETHARVLLSRQRRIIALRDNGDRQQALVEAQAVLEQVLATYGASTAFAADARMSLGRGLSDAQRYSEAAAQFRLAYEAWRTTVGEQHPQAVRSALNLAEMLAQDPAQRKATEIWYQRALNDGAQGLGADSPTVAFFRYRYASFLLEQQRPADALAVLASDDEIAALRALAAKTREAHAELLRRATDLACAGHAATDLHSDCLAGAAALRAATASPAS